MVSRLAMRTILNYFARTQVASLRHCTFIDTRSSCVVLRRCKSTSPPRLATPASEQHNDLDSFLAYAQQSGLKETSSVFKGTRYEYLVAESLGRLSFSLQRTGRSNDLGIDLIGTWNLPFRKTQHPMRVLVQCKATPPTPSMVRELEGAYIGAPAGWRDHTVLGMLVFSNSATEGVRAAVRRSQCPLATVCMTREGSVQQFLWNTAASDIGLAAMGVTLQYAESAEGPVASSVALTWQGRPWRSSLAHQS